MTELQAATGSARGGFMARMSATERFALQHVVMPNGCWEWTGTKTAGGYGQFTLNGVRTTAHRASYVLHVDEVPPTWHVDHLCRNRGCVNPAHLEAVTAQENGMRSGNPRLMRKFDTHCQRGHEFTDANTIRKANGTRRCRECANARDRLRPRRPSRKERELRD